MLSHPILADLIETEFIPCVINNRGDDAGGTVGGGENDATLERFNEPRLNNPVVRFVSSTGVEVAPRLSGQWTAETVFRGAASALEALRRPLPPWAEASMASPALASAVFTMD